MRYRVVLAHVLLWLDGVCAWQPAQKVEWCPHERLHDADVAKAVQRVRDR